MRKMIDHFDGLAAELRSLTKDNENTQPGY
jgi:hypothetical protein